MTATVRSRAQSGSIVNDNIYVFKAESVNHYLISKK